MLGEKTLETMAVQAIQLCPQEQVTRHTDGNAWPMMADWLPYEEAMQLELFRQSSVPLADVPCPAGDAWRGPEDRKTLTELLTMYDRPIKALLLELSPLIATHPVQDPLRIDKVFLLRYLLSKKTTVDAAAAATFALEYRRDEQNLMRARAIADAIGGSHCSWESLTHELVADDISQYCIEHVAFTSCGDWVSLVDFGTDKLQRAMNGDCNVIALHEMLLKEMIYQYLDFQTRKRGYLVKSYMSVDFTHLQWDTRWFWLVMRCLPTLSTVSHVSSKLYPQMEAASILSSSSIIDWLITLAKPFMSADSFKKIRIETSMPKETIDGLRLAQPLGQVVELQGMGCDFLATLQAQLGSAGQAELRAQASKQGAAAETEQGRGHATGCRASKFAGAVVDFIRRCRPCSCVSG